MAAIVEGAAFALDAPPPLFVIPLVIVLLVTISFYRLPVVYIPQKFVTPLKPLTPCAAVLSAVHLMFSLGWEAHLLFVVWLVLGSIAYISYGMHHSDEPAEQTTKQVQLQQAEGEHHDSNLMSGIAERSDAAL